MSVLAILPASSVRAQATAPSLGGEVSIISVTTTTMELRFGTLGTGEGRIVTMAATDGGMPVPLQATNGQFYPAAPAYGQGAPLGAGYVVYNGPDHTATVTGLLPGTSYYITNAEYNADGSSIAYNTTGSSMSTTTNRAAPLPVELTAFAGTVDAHGWAELRWTTATERSSAYFALERSADGATFAEAARVPAAGNSAQPLAYQWPDPRPLTRPTYYRLRQADRNGAVHYSAVVALAPSPRVAHTAEVYPNPSNGQAVHLLLHGFEGEALTLRLTDALGRPVWAQPLAPADAQYLAPLPLPASLAPGTYVLTLAGSGSPIQKRIVVTK